MPSSYTPWEPTVYTGSSDYSDELAAAEQYVATYGGSIDFEPGDGSGGSSYSGPSSYTTPDLSMAYTAAPDFIPAPEAASGSGSQQGLDTMFSVDLATLRSTEQTLLSGAQQLVEAYETLKGVVQSAASSPSVWGQEVGTTSYARPSGGGTTIDGGGSSPPRYLD
jgi:hypothetical protein